MHSLVVEAIIEVDDLMVVSTVHQIVPSVPNRFSWFITMELFLYLYLGTLGIIILQKNSSVKIKSYVPWLSHRFKGFDWMKKLGVFYTIAGLHVSFANVPESL